MRVSPEVYKYVAAAMMDHGMAYGPGSLEPSNKYMSKFIDGSIQGRVKYALKKNRRPTFDGSNQDDVQIMKSISVKDFSEYASRMLLTQLKMLFP